MNSSNISCPDTICACRAFTTCILAFVWILLCTKLHAFFSFWVYKPLKKHSPHVCWLPNTEGYNVPRFWVQTDACTICMYQTLLPCWEGPEYKASLVHTKLKFCFNCDWRLYRGGLVISICYSSRWYLLHFQSLCPISDQHLLHGKLMRGWDVNW